MQIGRRIYFEIETGNIILDKGEMQGAVIPTTVDQDIQNFTALSERNRDTYDIIELTFGQLTQDFAECNGYRVNPETREIEFSYPDPNEPAVPQPPQKALTTQIEELKAQLVVTQEAIDFLLMGGL